MGISSDVSRSWQGYNVSNSKENISSLKNNIKEDFSRGLESFKTSLNNTATTFVDLGNDIGEQVQSDWKTLTSTFTSVGATLGEQVNNLETGAKELVSKFNTALSNVGKKIDETFEKVEESLVKAKDWVMDAENWKKVGATIVVGGASVLTGIGDLGEKLVDGLTWCGGKLVEGGSFVVAKIQEKTGHEEAAQKTMDWRETMKTDVAGFISHDYVKEFEKYLFEDTKAGQAINAASWLKYDSKVAQGISTVTEKVAEFAAATAITIATGGAGFPAFLAVFGTGFVAGVGGSAEKNYANAKAEGKTPSIDDKNLNILVDGIGSGFNWYAQGKMGQGIFEALKAISKVGAKTFGSTMLSGLKESLTNLKGKSAKEVMAFLFSKSNLKSTLFNADNLTDSGGVVADNIASWINGDEEFNIKNLLGAGVELLGTSLINIVTGGIVDHAGKIDDAVEGADDILKNSDDVIEKVNDVSKSTDDIKKLQQEYDELVAYTNSEKGGFDAVYGRGADKARYDDSMARIREIEDVLKNTDNVSSSTINPIYSTTKNNSTGITNSGASFYQNPQYANLFSISDDTIKHYDSFEIDNMKKELQELDEIKQGVWYKKTKSDLDNHYCMLLNDANEVHRIDNRVFELEEALKNAERSNSINPNTFKENGMVVTKTIRDGNNFIVSPQSFDADTIKQINKNSRWKKTYVYVTSDTDPQKVFNYMKKQKNVVVVKDGMDIFYENGKCYSKVNQSFMTQLQQEPIKKNISRNTVSNSFTSSDYDDIFNFKKNKENLDNASQILNDWGKRNNVDNYAEQALREYAATGSAFQNINGEMTPYITNEGGVRAYIESLDPKVVDEYLNGIGVSKIKISFDGADFYPVVKKFDNAYSTMVDKFGIDETIARFKKFANGEVDLKYITKKNNARSIIGQMTPSELETCITLLKHSDNMEYMGTLTKTMGSSNTADINFHLLREKYGDTNFYIQKDFDINEANYSISDTIDEFKKLQNFSPELTSNVKEVTCTSIRNPDDGYWSNIHNEDFISAATGGNGTINFYKYSQPEEIKRIVTHEASHNYEIIDGFYTLSDSQYWKNAVINDGNFASSYAEEAFNSRIDGPLGEDFADSVANLNCMGATEFSKMYPNRAIILKQLFPEFFV